MQHRLFRHIAEVHAVHGDVAPEQSVGNGAVGLVGVFPCPCAGVLCAFGNGAILGNMAVDQGDIAVIGFRFFVHQLENTLGTCQRHNDGIDLVTDLTDGHVEAAAQGQEADQTAQRKQISVGENCHQTADNGQDGVLDIA